MPEILCNCIILHHYAELLHNPGEQNFQETELSWWTWYFPFLFEQLFQYLSDVMDSLFLHNPALQDLLEPDATR